MQLRVRCQPGTGEWWWVQVSAPAGGLDLADLLGGSSDNDSGSTAVPQLQGGLPLQSGSIHAPEQSAAASEMDDIFGAPAEPTAGDSLLTSK